MHFSEPREPCRFLHRGPGHVRRGACDDGDQGPQLAAQEEERGQAQAEGHQAEEEDAQKQVLIIFWIH